MNDSSLAPCGRHPPRGRVPDRETRRADFLRWARAALQGGGQVTIRLVEADEGQELNRDYRGKDYATNVLSFDYQHEPVVVADLVLCAPVLEAEALAAGTPLRDHYAHLLVHGTLHAQGWDHERVRDAKRMEARETALLAALGVPDPYAAR